tara:strand:+ start:319 stop:900 length:582 start_codon:yes stop_codon:yes gene_type:complete
MAYSMVFRVQFHKAGCAVARAAYQTDRNLHKENEMTKGPDCIVCGEECMGVNIKTTMDRDSDTVCYYCAQKIINKAIEVHAGHEPKPVVTVKIRKNASEYHGRGSDQGKTAAQYTIFSDGKQVGVIFGTDSHYMSGSDFEVYSLPEGSEHPRPLRLFTTTQGRPFAAAKKFAQSHDWAAQAKKDEEDRRSVTS